ncbi:MAG: prephenate dehydrogenase [Cyanobacteria bacterium RYN_339]|nr:prephenate dehydrogenase [Cyanobacteria bacterium RYN_339]
MNVGLIGLGLIGGSLGLALRAAGLATRVVGYDRSAADLKLAVERGAIDRAAGSAAEAVADADLVVLATPVLAMQGLLAELAPVLKPGAVVTDLASTKAAVTGWAAEAGITFVGGHPMAGSEKSGMAAARLNLLRGAVYIITASPDTPVSAVDLVERLARGIGARPLRMAPEAHDRAVAAVSHVPFLASTAIVRVTTHAEEWDGWAPIASTGYRDATRLASGDPAMYRDICLTNGAAIAPMLRDLAQELERIAAGLEDRGLLDELFTDARDRRDAWVQGQGSFRLP